MTTITSDVSLLRANTALIEYPRFKELHKEIRMCQQMSKIMGEPQCLSLEGITGAGKSTLVKAYADSFTRVHSLYETHIPVFYVQTPSPVGIRDMASMLLYRLGDPAYERGTRASMTMRLVRLIKSCGVELVILDDFHHLIDTQTNHILASVSDWLKVLIKETGVPFMVVGIDGRVEVILRANSQLSRLFAARETLKPFELDWDRQQTIQDYSCFVNYVEQAIEKPLATNLKRTELLYRIHYATGGVVGNLMNLMRYAAMLAVERGETALDLTLLSLAFQKRLAGHFRDKADPFVETNRNLPLPPQEPKPDQPGQKKKGRKKRGPSANDVLSAK